MKIKISIRKHVAELLLLSMFFSLLSPLFCIKVDADNPADTTPPTIDSCTISGVTTIGGVSFFSQDASISVSAHDDVSDNSIKIIKETYISDSLVNTTEYDLDTSTGDIQFGIGYFGVGNVYFKIYAEDGAGNRTENPVILPSGGAALFDGMSPRIDVSAGDNTYINGDCDVFIGKDDTVGGIDITLSVSDNPIDEDTGDEITGNSSGLSSFAVYLNDIQINNEYVEPDEEHPNGSSGEAIKTTFSNDEYSYGPIHINTRQLTSAQIFDSQHFVLRVDASDRIGNSTSKIINIYVDETAPEVVRTKIADVDISDGFNKYSYINKSAPDPIHVDVVDPHDDNVGGYESGVDILKYTFVSTNGDKSSGQVEIDGNSADINIPGDFKGNLEIIAVDNVGNESKTSYKTQGIIIESQNKHNSEKHIIVNLPETINKDKDGHNLYNSNTGVEIEVIDNYSGVAKLEYEVIAPFDEGFKGSIDFSSDEKEGFTVGTDKYGLKDSAKGKITIPCNSNNITMKLHMYDRLGYEDSAEVTLSIDKNKPVIETKLLNSNADVDYQNYYNANQTVEIKVSDSNFNPSAVTVSCNKNILNAKVDGFTLESVSSNGVSTYKATVQYSADDEYNVCISATDMAGNSVSKNNSERFIIDTTSPSIEYSFDEAAGKGIYYREDRILHVKVKDINFSQARTSLSSNMANSYLPYMHEWEGDTDKSYYERTGINTSSVSFNSSGIYDFDITSTDKAGNSVSVNVPRFIVDKEAPTIEYSGVVYGDTYQKEVSPIIKIKDTNYDKEATTVSVNGALHGTMELDDIISSYEDVDKGQNIVFKSVGGKRELDDIYTITVVNEDKAGNITTSDMIFTLNSSGSRFEKNITEEDLYNGYLKNNKAITVTEINPDAINTKDIVVTLYKNGVPTILDRDDDYKLVYTKDEYGYSCYQYIINEKEISLDGIYEVTIQSTDKAGNINESMSDYNNLDCRFAVDNSAPNIITYDLKTGDRIKTSEYSLYFSVFDNMELSDIKVLDNNIELEVTEEDGQYCVTLSEASDKRTICLIARDKAGNESQIVIDNVIVNRSWLKKTMESKVGKITMIVMGIIIVSGLTILIIKKCGIVFTKNRI